MPVRDGSRMVLGWFWDGFGVVEGLFGGCLGIVQRLFVGCLEVVSGLIGICSRFVVALSGGYCGLLWGVVVGVSGSFGPRGRYVASPSPPPVSNGLYT